MVESNNVTGVSSSQTSKTTTKSTSGQDITNEDFLVLLLTQMRNQDPLEPMKNQEFMSQLTQMNSLSALKSMDSNLKKMTTQSEITEATALIGKKVEVSAKSISGVVSSVSFEDGSVMVQIGSQKVALSEITSVTSA
ncbi:MAG: flagellar hook capping FlgD N-terminal domain-containing protein [Chloroflexota bacterium]|jgi:flagellar basal-body rod modification protein FlgD